MIGTDPTASSATNALGTVLGYIGAEAATDEVFKRLLWPQRTYGNFSFSHIFRTALLLPTGGPLYKAALQALDCLRIHGLFQGREQGHMLGSPFFPDEGWTYTMHSSDDKWAQHTEPSRDNLRARVVALLPSPRTFETRCDTETGSANEMVAVRARVAVHHFTLSVKRSGTPDDQRPIFANGEETSLSIRAILEILTTEASGIVVAAIVASVWRSWFAVLWTGPLLLKMFSAAMSLRREALDLASLDMSQDPSQDFEVHIPSAKSMFLLVTGPPPLVLQFFRHYGHPKRDRMREIVHLAIIITYGGLFPLGLLCSVAWMPLPIQYVWLSYQMYVVGAMYISRFVGVEHWASIEEKLAAALAQTSSTGPRTLWSDDSTSTAVNAVLETTYFDRYGRGRSYKHHLLKRAIVPCADRSEKAKSLP